MKIKNYSPIIIFVLILILILTFTACENDRRDGSFERPYLIRGTWDLQKIGSGDYGLDDYYELDQSITLHSENFKPAGDENRPFNGTIWGNGHYINIEIDIEANSEYGGLLGYIGNEGKVKDLRLQGQLSGGTKYTGLIAGVNEGTIRNIRYGNRQENGEPFGSGDIEGYGTTGGIVGKNMGLIKQCLTTEGGLYGGFELTEDNSNGGTGGIAGYNKEGKIEQTFSGITVHGNDNTGSLVGYDKDGVIKNSYANLTVNINEKLSPKNLGLFIGKSEDSTIKNSYSGGPSSYFNNVDSEENVGTFIGHLVINEKVSELHNCIRIINEEKNSKNNNPIGNISTNGRNIENIKIIELTEENMQIPNSFSENGFDFEDIWTKDSKFQHYPLLNWELDHLE